MAKKKIRKANIILSHNEPHFNSYAYALNAQTTIENTVPCSFLHCIDNVYIKFLRSDKIPIFTTIG